MLFSLSKSRTEFWLDASEWALLAFGIVLSVGLIAELLDKSRTFREFLKRPKWPEFLVVIGVAGEIFSDGGIFLFGRHLQTISDDEVKTATAHASFANKLAGEARKDAEAARRETALVQSNNLALAMQVEELRKGNLELERQLIDAKAELVAMQGAIYERSIKDREASGRRLAIFTNINFTFTWALDQDEFSLQMLRMLFVAKWNRMFSGPSTTNSPSLNGPGLTQIEVMLSPEHTNDWQKFHLAARALRSELFTNGISAEIVIPNSIFRTNQLNIKVPMKGTPDLEKRWRRIIAQQISEEPR